MSEKFVLEHTVHHNGHIYTAGTEADDIGEVAGEFGQHVWEGGRGPAKKAKTEDGQGDDSGQGAFLAGGALVPPPSALPTPPAAPAPEAPPASDTTSDTTGDTGSSKRGATSGRRTGA